MFYTEFPPSPALSPYLRCIWVFETSANDDADGEQRIVPDGHPEMVLHYGDCFHEVRDDAAVAQSRLLFAGQISRPLLLRPGARAGVIGIRFQAAAARALLGMSMLENTDTRLDLTQAWGRDGESLLDEVHSAVGIGERVSAVERFLIRRFKKSATLPDRAVTHSVDILHAAAGRITIDDLAARCGLSARQLERRFLDEVGIPPRLLASIFRFRRVFDLLEQPQPGRWIGAALSAGYFDQAHMIRDFKRFAGQQPQAFYLSLNGLSAAMLGGDAESP